MLVTQGWAAARLSRCEGDDPASRHLRAAARYFLSHLASRAENAAKQVLPDASLLSAFGDLA
jgi:hypothetical protein